MVRRLKADLRDLGEQFPHRTVEPIPLGGLAKDAPELVLARRLREYGAVRDVRLARSRSSDARHGRLAFVGLQQRLLSSIAAFGATLRVHRTGLEKRGRAVFGGGCGLHRGGARHRRRACGRDGRRSFAAVRR